MKRLQNPPGSQTHQPQEKEGKKAAGTPDSECISMAGIAAAAKALQDAISQDEHCRKVALAELDLIPRDQLRAAAKKLASDRELVRNALLLALNKDAGEEGFLACLVLREAGINPVKEAFRKLMADDEAGPEALDAYTELIRGMFVKEGKEAGAEDIGQEPKNARDPDADKPGEKSIGGDNPNENEKGQTRLESRMKKEVWQQLRRDLEAVGISEELVNEIMVHEKMRPSYSGRLNRMIEELGKEGAKGLLEEQNKILWIPIDAQFYERVRSKRVVAERLKEMEEENRAAAGTVKPGTPLTESGDRKESTEEPKQEPPGARAARRRGKEGWKEIADELCRIGVCAETIEKVLDDYQMRPCRIKRIHEMIAELGDEGARIAIEENHKIMRMPEEDHFRGRVARWKERRASEEADAKPIALQEAGGQINESVLPHGAYQHAPSEPETMEPLAPSPPGATHLKAGHTEPETSNVQQDATDQEAKVDLSLRRKELQEQICKLIKSKVGSACSDEVELATLLDRFQKSALNFSKQAEYEAANPGRLLEEEVLENVQLLAERADLNEAKTFFWYYGAYIGRPNDQKKHFILESHVFPNFRESYARKIWEQLFSFGIGREERLIVGTAIQSNPDKAKEASYAIAKIIHSGEKDPKALVAAALSVLNESPKSPEPDSPSTPPGKQDTGVTGFQSSVSSHEHGTLDTKHSTLNTGHGTPNTEHRRHALAPIELPSRWERQLAARESIRSMIISKLESLDGNGKRAEQVAGIVMSRALTSSFKMKDSQASGMTLEEIVERRVRVYLSIASSERARLMLEQKAGWFGSQEALGAFPGFLEAELRSQCATVLNCAEGKSLWKELAVAGADAATRAEIILKIGIDMDALRTAHERLAAYSGTLDAAALRKAISYLGGRLAAEDKEFSEANARFLIVDAALDSLHRTGIDGAVLDDMRNVLLSLPEAHFTKACEQLSGIVRDGIGDKACGVAGLLKGIVVMAPEPQMMEKIPMEAENIDSVGKKAGWEESQDRAMLEDTARKTFGESVNDALVDALYAEQEMARARMERINESIGTGSASPLVSPLLAKAIALFEQDFTAALQEARARLINSELSRLGVRASECQGITVAARTKENTPLPRILKKIRELADPESGIGPDFGPVVSAFQERNRLFLDADFFREKKEVLVRERKARLETIKSAIPRHFTDTSGIDEVISKLPSTEIVSKLEVIRREYVMEQRVTLAGLSPLMLLNELDVIRNAISWRLRKKVEAKGPLARSVTAETRVLLEEIGEELKSETRDVEMEVAAGTCQGPGSCAQAALRLKDMVALFGMICAQEITGNDVTILTCQEEEYNKRIEYHMEMDSLTRQLKDLQISEEAVQAISNSCADPWQARMNAERTMRELGAQAGKYITAHPDALLQGEKELDDALLSELMKDDEIDCSEAEPETQEKQCENGEAQGAGKDAPGFAELNREWKSALDGIRGEYKRNIASVMSRQGIVVPDHPKWIIEIVENHASELGREAIKAVKQHFEVADERSLEAIIRSVQFDTQTAGEIRRYGIEPVDIAIAICKGFDYKVNKDGCTIKRTEHRRDTFSKNLKKTGLEAETTIRALTRLGVVRLFHNGHADIVELVSRPESETAKQIIQMINEHLERAIGNRNAIGT